MNVTDRAMASEEWVRIEALEVLFGATCDRIRELEAENERHMIQIGDLKALRTLLNGEVEQLRAGVSWARGMCTDGAPRERIDHFLGCVLAGHAQLPAASDEIHRGGPDGH